MQKKSLLLATKKNISGRSNYAKIVSVILL